MNITFIVGNGLDISLDLQTSYAEFYDHILDIRKKAESKNSIYAAIQKDHENWSDFEEALGKYTEGIEQVYTKQDKQKFTDDFFESYDEVLEDLANYLALKEEEFAKKEKTYLIKTSDIYEGLKEGAARKIISLISNNFIRMDFITLNYTNVLETILNPHKETLRHRGIELRPIHHAHGSLMEYLTIGVNDESQLSAAFEDEHRDNLIKNKLLESMDDDRLTTTHDIIDNSDVIVLFGVSLGETDAYLWRRITKWLRSNTQRHIILHDFDESYINNKPRNPIRIKLLDSQAKERLLRHVDDLDGDELVQLRSRILVIRNTERLFKF